MDQTGDVSGYSSAYDSFFMGAHLQQIQLFGIIPEAMERRELQSRTPGYIGKSLGELSFRQNFGVNVVAITRGDLNIYIPKSSEHIYPQDKLTVVGTDTQLQEFRNRIEDVKNTSDMDAVDKKITLHSFTVDEEFRFLNQTIAQSHLGEKHDSIVVAIERNDELITLDKDTTFQLGDLVWIVGNREKIREILYLT